MTCVRTSVGALSAAIAASLIFSPISHAQSCEPRWDIPFGASGPNSDVWDFQAFDDGSGPVLYATGQFSSFQGLPIWGIARWDGRTWTDVGGGLTKNGRNGVGLSLTVWDDGTGPALFVAGDFDHAGNVPASKVAKWDGAQWSALDSGIDSIVRSLATFDDGRGESLYAGGRFTSAGGHAAECVARWDGANWEALADGLHASSFGVTCLTAYDDGNGRALYAGGDFDHSGANELRYLAKWNGREWSAIDGLPLTSRSIQGSHVDELLVWDDGNGPALYISGDIKVTDGPECLVRWDGTSWVSPIQLHFSGAFHIDGMAVHDDGSGESLWVGAGSFTLPGEEIGTTIARWNGQQWWRPDMSPRTWINTLASFNDGFGTALYAGGDLDHFQPGNEPISNLTRWSTPHMVLAHTTLRAGERARFITTCSTPDRRVYFVYSTTGLGSFYVPQLNVTLDLNRPRLAGSDVAGADGKAVLIRRLPPNSTGTTLHLQAAEQGRKSEVVQAQIE